MTEPISAFITANLAAGATVAAVALLRRPVRAWFGARIAYGLWLLVPLAAIASLAPPRSAALSSAPPVTPSAVVGFAEDRLEWFLSDDLREAAGPAAASLSSGTVLTVLWLAGMLAMFGWLAMRQIQFARARRRGEAGPAVVGVLAPRIIVPSDFEARFDRRERALVLAHETVHLNRHDARLNAAVALARCVCWFNPLVHLAAHLMRIDQEMACDAAVVERHPGARGAYAQALLKAQLNARPLPLGCYWPAGTEHPLMERIAMLKSDKPTLSRRLSGIGLIAALGILGGYAAWAAQPPVPRTPAVAVPGPAASPAPTTEAETASEPPAEVLRLPAQVSLSNAGGDLARFDRDEAAIERAIAALDMPGLLAAGGSAAEAAVILRARCAQEAVRDCGYLPRVGGEQWSIGPTGMLFVGGVPANAGDPPGFVTAGVAWVENVDRPDILAEVAEREARYARAMAEAGISPPAPRTPLGQDYLMPDGTVRTYIHGWRLEDGTEQASNVVVPEGAEPISRAEAAERRAATPPRF